MISVHHQVAVFTFLEVYVLESVGHEFMQKPRTRTKFVSVDWTKQSACVDRSHG